MILSLVNYVGNGSQVIFAITFNYLDESFVGASLDGVAESGFSIVGGDVVFATAPIDGALVKLFRTTPRNEDGRLVDFSNGSVLSESDLDTAHIQLLHIAQEAHDKGGSATGDIFLTYENNLAAYNANSNTIVNLPAPTADSEAATKAYVDANSLDKSSGSWDAGSVRIINLLDPVDLGDAVSKDYVDSLAFQGGGINARATDGSISGGNSTYTLGNMPNAFAKGVIVSLNGALLIPETDFTITAGDPNSSITFVTATSNGDSWIVQSIGEIRYVPVSSLDDDSITEVKIDAEAISTRVLAASAVTTAKLAADAVDDTKIADDAVGAEHIQTGAVGSPELAAGGVDNVAIAALAIDSTQLLKSAFHTVVGSPAKNQYFTVDKDTGDLTFDVLTYLDIDLSAYPATVPINDFGKADNHFQINTSTALPIYKITGVADPTQDQDAATKSYVDTAVTSASATVSGSDLGKQWKVDTTVIVAPPLSGYVVFNHATHSSATKLYISETSDSGQVVRAITNKLSTGDRVVINHTTDPSIHAAYNITGSVVDNGTYVTLNVTYQYGNGVFLDEVDSIIDFTVLSGDVYVPLDGSTAMSGDLDLGTNNVTNVGTVDGRDIAADGATQDSHIADATLHFTEASIDHGSIAGLADDDHTQYTLVDGTRAFTGNQSFGGFNITDVDKITIGDSAAASTVSIANLVNTSGNIDVFQGTISPVHSANAGDVYIKSSGTASTIFVNQGTTSWLRLIRSDDPQASRGFAAVVTSGSTITPTATLTLVPFDNGTAIVNNGFVLEESVGASGNYDQLTWNGGRTATFEIDLKCTGKSSAAVEFEMRVIPYSYNGAETAITSTICYVGTPARNTAKNSSAVTGTVELNDGESIRFKQSSINSTAGKIDSFGVAATIHEIFSDDD